MSFGFGFRFGALRGGAGGPITANVVTNRSAASDTGVAPFAVQFDASGTTAATITSRPFHELYHSWNFGDEDVSTWSYGTQAGVAKKNRATGPIAAHVYETAGTYTVTYTAIDPLTGISSVATKTITVTDPDTVFSGANTICIANGTLPVAGVGGVPAGATCYNETTWAGVISRLATGKRVLLKKGDTWNCGVGNGAFNVAGPGIVGAYGSGANPKILYTAASAGAFTPGLLAQDWRFMDLEGDATGLASGAARNLTRFFNAGSGTVTALGTATSGRYSTLLRITQNNSGGLAYLGNDCTVVDSVCDNLNGGSGNVSFFTQVHENIAIMGCSAQTATLGEHCMRLQGTQKSVLSNNTLTFPPTTKHAFTLRGYANGVDWTGDYTEKVVFSNNVCTSAFGQCTMIQPTNTSTDERFRNVLFERNSVDTSTAATFAVGLGVNGGLEITIRNNLFKMTTGPTGINLNKGSAVVSNGSVSPPVDGCYVYNNSFYSAGVSASALQAVDIVYASNANISVFNNLCYAPSHSGTKLMVKNSVAATPVTITTNTTDGQITTNPNFTATPPVAYTDWKCTSGYTLNGGTTVPVYDDFFSAARTYPTADMGAVNP